MTNSTAVDEPNIPNDETLYEEAEAMKRIFESKKKELKLTQKGLAASFGVFPPTIFAYLNAKTPLNVKFASFFSEQLQVPIDSFSPRIAQALLKITGQIANETYSYPLISFNEAGNYKEIISNIKKGALTANKYPSTLNLGPNAFWVTLETDEMESYNGGLSFFKGTLLLVQPDVKLQVNDFALLKLSHSTANVNSFIESDESYIFRAIVRDGDKLEAVAFNPNCTAIEISNSNATLVGKVVSAIIPPELFKL
ncbi:S24 family peptidase [Acinetobacter proteolyticus]|uniref:HTH cro/C1-type domain-containing protein n=1 Tax=Acinetobacter proteolyticus TaxID=1776741 RepID=A0A2N0WIA3_9GAMM|nr:S24 family peptidase [Acinetobacter proteolyticus]PKF35528.1 hypothetical protein CW311_04360 [Acinetobacter proteolyticus]